MKLLNFYFFVFRGNSQIGEIVFYVGGKIKKFVVEEMCFCFFVFLFSYYSCYLERAQKQGRVVGRMFRDFVNLL